MVTPTKKKQFEILGHPSFDQRKRSANPPQGSGLRRTPRKVTNPGMNNSQLDIILVEGEGHRRTSLLGSADDAGTPDKKNKTMIEDFFSKSPD